MLIFFVLPSRSLLLIGIDVKYGERRQRFYRIAGLLNTMLCVDRQRKNTLLLTGIDSAALGKYFSLQICHGDEFTRLSLLTVSL